jgi:hypothetical protein
VKTRAAAVIVVCVLVVFWTHGCGSSESEDSAGLAELTVQVLYGDIHADLMPPVPADPIVCSLTLRMMNNDADKPLSGLSIPTASVFLSRTSEELGTIGFRTDWDGLIEAGDVDTVTVTKIAESQEAFPPPCGESVFLRVKIVKTTVQTKQVSTPSYGFSCPMASEP